MHKLWILTGLAGLAFSATAFRQEKAKDDTEVAALLDDRSQPWWNNHRPPKVKGPMEYRMSPSHDLGAREDPPIYTAQMPPKVAQWLASGGKPKEGHPLAGRPFMMVDVRRGSEFMAERFQGAVNLPASGIDSSLEEGDLSKLDRKTILVVFGSRWPHFELISKIKGKGFDALYAMEGLHGWKAAGLPVERDEKLARFLKVIDSEPSRTPAAGPAPEPPPMPLRPGIEPLALKILMDAGVDLFAVFVGDRLSYENGHVPGAVHIPLADLDAKLAKADRNRLMVVLCGCCQGKRGGPSENAIDRLTEMGFKRVLHLDGHMYAWKTAGLPVENDDPPKK